MTARWASFVLTLALVLCPQAGAITLVDDTANLVELTGPQDFRDDGPLQSNTDIYIFMERSSYVLPADVTVNARLPGTYTTAGPSEVVAMGQHVNIFFIHMDPLSQYLPSPTNRHTWEANDSLTISADLRTLTIDELRVGNSDTFADQIRVIVAAPEPHTAVLFGAGLAGLALVRRRRTVGSSR